MVVRIRLQRIGVKNCPYYRVVAADQRAPRDGKFLEILGTYSPEVDKKRNAKYLRLKSHRIKYWLSVGAQPSDRVNRLLGQFGILPMPPTKSRFVVDMTDYLPDEYRPKVLNAMEPPEKKALRAERQKLGPSRPMVASDIPEDHLLIRNDQVNTFVPHATGPMTEWDANAYLDRLAAQSYHLVRFKDKLPVKGQVTVAEHRRWMDQVYADPVSALSKHSSEPRPGRPHNVMSMARKLNHQFLFDLQAHSNLDDIRMIHTPTINRDLHYLKENNPEEYQRMLNDTKAGTPEALDLDEGSDADESPARSEM